MFDNKEGIDRGMNKKLVVAFASVGVIVSVFVIEALIQAITGESMLIAIFEFMRDKLEGIFSSVKLPTN